MNDREWDEMAVTRRHFLGVCGSAAALATGAASGLGAELALAGEANQQPSQSPALPAKKLKLGLDNFAVRGMEWKARELIEYAAGLKLDSLFISDLDALGSLEPADLQGVRSFAHDQGLQLHVGTWSICPTSKRFRDTWGTAEEHLALGIRVAAALGSPVLRVILGGGDDRLTPGGIEARIADTVRVLKSARGVAKDHDVKIAVENHAGDLQAGELVQLIEEAGRDYVGANMDSGNAVWSLEHPLENLEVLGPYVLTTSLRDSAVWETPRGATVQWTAMGDGQVDWKAYFARFAELCPNVPVHIETISGFNREIPYLTTDFWFAYPKARARDFARFLALAKQGTPRDPHKLPEGAARKAADQAYQKAEIERSLRYCREVLGLGVRA